MHVLSSEEEFFQSWTLAHRREIGKRQAEASHVNKVGKHSVFEGMRRLLGEHASKRKRRELKFLSPHGKFASNLHCIGQ